MLLRFKKILRNVIDNKIQNLYWLKFWFFLKTIKNEQELVIFDLDNTLADTYPCIKNKIDLTKVYAQLKVHNGTKSMLIEHLKSDKVIILSARPYKYRKVTEQWVTDNLVGSKKKLSIFLVHKVNLKLRYLLAATKSKKSITYYDDLSYNHENGEVKFYYEIIQSVRNLPLRYIDYNQIRKINHDS